MIRKKTGRNRWLIIYLVLTSLILNLRYEKAYAINDGITISFKNELLSEAIKKLENISGYSFAYQSDILPRNYRVTKSYTNSSIEAILSTLLKGTGISFQLIDKHVIIKKKKKRTKYTLSGYVGNTETGKKLVNVNVYEEQTNLAVASNEYGYYNLILPEGVYNIIFSYIGMQSEKKQIVFDKNRRLDIELKPNMEIEEVLVTSTEKEMFVKKDAPIGYMKMNPKEMTELPVIMGEPDVFKYIQMLPGMQSGMEANGALYVRGGEASHNLVLMDNVPLYNCFHFMGFFSVINSDMVNSTKLYKGGFPARYGGRLASVIDMGVTEGSYKKIRGKVSLGLIASKLFLEGPIIKDKTSFALSGRMGYYDFYGKFLNPKLTDDKEIVDYNFKDYNLKLTHKLSNEQTIYMTLYHGNDIGKEINRYSISEEGGSVFEEKTDGQNWRNTISTIGWKGKINSKLFSNIQLALSNYNYRSYLNDTSFRRYMFETGISPNNSWEEIVSTYFNSSKIESNVLNKMVISDFQFELNPKLKIESGYKYSQIEMRSENNISFHYTDSENPSYDYFNDETINHYQHKTDEHSAYIDFKLSINEQIGFTTGVYTSFYKTKKYSNQSYQPRITVNWEVLPELMIKGGYCQMVQHFHHLQAKKIKKASDLLVAAIQEAPSETSDNYSLGISCYKSKYFDFHVELYYKKMDNLINFNEGASFVSKSETWNEKIVSGKGNSKGIELLVEKNKGKFSGWLGYTLSKSSRQFEGINMGFSFPFRFEHRHHLNLFAKYIISKKWSLSANWIYHTGNKETIPNVFYWDINELYGSKMGFTTNAAIRQLFNNQKNVYSNPDYHRLDISLSYERKNRFGKAKWNLSVFNLYNRINVYSSRFGYDFVTIKGKISYRTRTKSEYKYLGIIPSISYSLCF